MIVAFYRVVYLQQVCRHTDEWRVAFGSNDKNAIKYSTTDLHDRSSRDVKWLVFTGRSRPRCLFIKCRHSTHACYFCTIIAKEFPVLEVQKLFAKHLQLMPVWRSICTCLLKPQHGAIRHTGSDQNLTNTTSQSRSLKIIYFGTDERRMTTALWFDVVWFLLLYNNVGLTSEEPNIQQSKTRRIAVFNYPTIPCTSTRVWHPVFKASLQISR